MIRVFPLLVLVVVGVVLFRWMTSGGGAAIAERRRRARAGRDPMGARDWDPQAGQLKRQIKGISGPTPNKDAIVAFLETHTGVEAYVEPKTVVSPLSVVLVDGDGAWRRFELGEDRYLRQLAKTHRLTVFDASRTGYPPRMRRTQEPPPPA